MSGHRKPAWARHRTDRGSALWIDYLRQCGVSYATLGGPIDGVAWLDDRVCLVDFKSSDKAPLTVGQGKLLARGCPVWFVWDERSARAVVERLREAV